MNENIIEDKKTVSYEDFQKLEIKIGEIKVVSKVDKSDKLLLLEVDFAEEKNRTVVSGIGQFFVEPQVLIGQKCAFVTNLEPRLIMGIESQAMILACNDGSKLAVLSVGQDFPSGIKVK